MCNGRSLNVTRTLIGGDTGECVGYHACTHVLVAHKVPLRRWATLTASETEKSVVA